MHWTDLAPVLSATSSRDCIWIMFSTQLELPPMSRHRHAVSLGPVGWAETELAGNDGGKSPATVSAKLWMIAGKYGRCQTLPDKELEEQLLSLMQHRAGVADFELARPLDVQGLDDTI